MSFPQENLSNSAQNKVLQTAVENTQVEGNLTIGSITQVVNLTPLVDEDKREKLLKRFHLPKLFGSPVFVNRPKEIKKIKDELEQGGAVVVLWSPCGYGKTTLAKLICWDLSIQEYYTGGIYYIEINNALDVKKGIKKLHNYLTNLEKDVEPEELVDRWNEEPTLIVLDNIQSQHQLELFLRTRGKYCQFLVTTEKLNIFKTLAVISSSSI